MDSIIYDLACYRIDKAKADLAASKIMLDNNLFAQSLNRSYYSIFHAVRSILAFDKYDSKKHSGIIAYFNQNYINKGIFDKRYSKILMKAERIRNKSDYNDFFIASKKEAEEQIIDAEEFLKVMIDYVNERITKI